jgi:hypothetical protein
MPRNRYSIGELTTTYKDVVVAAPSNPLVLRWMWIANTGSAAAKLTIAHVPSGQDRDDGMSLVYELTMTAGTKEIEEILVYMEPGDKIVAKTDIASSFTLTFYGGGSYTADALQFPPPPGGAY